MDYYKHVITDELEAGGMGSEESSTDEDFDPNAIDPEAKSGGDEEYDSDFADRSTDSEDRGDSDASVSSITSPCKNRSKFSLFSHILQISIHGGTLFCT